MILASDRVTHRNFLAPYRNYAGGAKRTFCWIFFFGFGPTESGSKSTSIPLQWLIADKKATMTHRCDEYDHGGSGTMMGPLPMRYISPSHQGCPWHCKDLQGVASIKWLHTFGIV